MTSRPRRVLPHTFRSIPLLLGLVLGAVGVPGPGHAESLAFVDVNVISMTASEPLMRQTVVIDAGRIVSVKPSSETQLPRDATVIQAQDKYLMPGLAEMHAHIPGAQSSQLSDVLTLYVSQGITTIRGMLGQPSHLDLREQAARSDIFAPNIITSGPSFNGNSVSSPEQGAQMVQAQKKAGYDFLKLHPGLSRAEFDAIAETARSLQIPFAGHVASEVGLARALEARQDSIDHLDDFIRALVPEGSSILKLPPAFFGINMAQAADLSAVPALAREAAQAGIWVVPTETLMVNLAGTESADELASRPESAYVPEATVRQWRNSKTQFMAQTTKEDREAFLEARKQLLKGLHDAGAGILLGSDAPQVFNVPGFSLHREMALMVAAGMTPYEVLRTGTVNVARYFGLDDSGKIATGYRADLVLLDGNPLADINQTRSIGGVVLRGQWHAGDDLDERLSQIRARHADGP